MNIRDSTGSGLIVNIVNTLVRFAQLIVAATVLGVYAGQVDYWTGHGIPSKISFTLAVGSLSLLTSLAFGIVPYFLSYFPIAAAFAWDWILFLLWCAVFGFMKAIFYWGQTEPFHYHGKLSTKEFDEHWKTMVRAVWIDLAAMILFLISGIMGTVLFWMGKKTSRGRKRGYV